MTKFESDQLSPPLRNVIAGSALVGVGGYFGAWVFRRGGRAGGETTKSVTSSRLLRPSRRLSRVPDPKSWEVWRCVRMVIRTAASFFPRVPTAALDLTRFLSDFQNKLSRCAV